MAKEIMKDEIQARLTVYGHGEMTDTQFKLFKKWIKATAEDMQKQKRGDLSKRYRATLFKVS